MLPELRTADQSRTYGSAYAEIYDAIFPRDAAAARTASFLFDLAGSASGPAQPRAVELGVGTGRVAIPLADLGCEVIGVDSSEELLRHCAREGAGVPLALVYGDARTWTGDGSADLAYCICATISMFASAAEQREVLRAARTAIHDRGVVVVETHSPAAILHEHRHREVIERSCQLASGYDATSRSVVHPTDGLWTLTFTWQKGGVVNSASEFSQLTSPERLADLARGADLVEVARYSNWSGEPYDPALPMYVSVYRTTQSAQLAAR